MNDSFQGILQKMGSNFIVTAFVPALGFIILSLFIFEPVFPASVSQRLGVVDFSEINFEKLSAFAVMLFIFTTILGFTLFTLSTYIYKSFEGYTFILGTDIGIRQTLLRRQKRRAKKLQIESERIEKEILKLENKKSAWKEKSDESNPWQERKEKRLFLRESSLRDKKYALVAAYQNNFPPINYVLPTRFGNILRAAEVYPNLRYGIDAVPIWGRLAHTMPESGMEKVDQANNQCLFLLNCCLLSVVFAGLSFTVSGYQAITTILARQGYKELLYFIPIHPKSVYIYQQRVVIYLVLSVIGLIIARLFYEASLVNVGHYGNMIRSSFDLYRFELISAFHHSLPKDLEEEIDLWRKISRFIVGGTKLGKVEIVYEHPPPKKSTD